MNTMPIEIEPESIIAAVALFAGILLCLAIGHKVANIQISRSKAGEVKGAPPIEAALFGLLGLLIAFTFNGASARFDARRNMIVDEANRIATAYSRVDLLPEETQPALREKFREYVDSRLLTYRKIPDMDAVYAELARSKDLQKQIWTMSFAATQNSKWPPAGAVVLPTLSQMFEITTTRTMAAQMHPPNVIFAMLAILVMAVALLAGFSMALSKSRSWLHIVVFSVIFALSVYVILDMEWPRMGLIRVDAFDIVLVELRESMN